MHVSLDKYAFFAVTGSLTTLEKLSELLKIENARVQERFDDNNIYIRSIGELHSGSMSIEKRKFTIRRSQFSKPPVSTTTYELVVLHPEHFLQNGSVLVRYERGNGQVSARTYVPGPDRTLRESPGIDSVCPCFPSFTFESTRPASLSLNPFLVILNAEIKLRRYLRVAGRQNALPADVMQLVHKTIELVDLIYWQPTVRPNTAAAEVARL